MLGGNMLPKPGAIFNRGHGPPHSRPARSKQKLR
jgi:hypothetical protein